MNETAGHKQVCLEFDDNERLRLICGQHNRHLARIEQALGVGMNSFGNQITISGEGDNVDRARPLPACIVNYQIMKQEKK